MGTVTFSCDYHISPYILPFFFFSSFKVLSLQLKMLAPRKIMAYTFELYSSIWIPRAFKTDVGNEITNSQKYI